jgi:hypothetical protein
MDYGNQQVHLFPIVFGIDIGRTIGGSPVVKGSCKLAQSLAFVDKHVETFGLV